MHKMTWCLFSVLLAAGVWAAPPPASEPNVKKWQDERGVWHYGDARPISPDAATNSAADAYRRGDYPAAFREYLVWAKQGDPNAQTIIGQMYLRGEGVGTSQSSTIERVRRAARQDNA